MPNYVYRIQRNVAVSASTGREIVDRTSMVASTCILIRALRHTRFQNAIDTTFTS